MTTECQPEFRISSPPLHTWATDLARHASRLVGHEPSHAVGHAIFLIAATMEEHAAQQEPEENQQCGAVLHRSAARMYLNAAPSYHRAAQDARRMALAGLQMAPPGAEHELNKVLHDIAARMQHDFRDPDPEPWLACCSCHRPLSQSRYLARDLTARELDETTIVGHLCSQCEWSKITVLSTHPPNPHDVLEAHRDIFNTMTSLGRRRDANSWLIHRLSRNVADQEKHALVTTVRDAEHDIASAILDGRFIPFGISTHAAERPEP